MDNIFDWLSFLHKINFIFAALSKLASLTSFSSKGQISYENEDSYETSICAEEVSNSMIDVILNKVGEEI